MVNEQLEECQNDIATLQTNPDEMAAMEYADRDIARQAIMYHSDDTYVAKNWK